MCSGQPARTEIQMKSFFVAIVLEADHSFIHNLQEISPTVHSEFKPSRTSTVLNDSGCLH